VVNPATAAFKHFVYDISRQGQVRFVNDAMKFVGGIHVAVAKVELHHVGW